MRPSPQEKITPIEVDASAAEFFEQVAKAVPAPQRRPAIVLVGGGDFCSSAVRRAQAPLRFDLRASRWSHAALICDWSSEDASQATGVEAAIEPAPGLRHDPERNGATAFKLQRYIDDEAYPNLAVAVILDAPASSGDVEDEEETSTVPADFRDRVVEAATDANAGRPQFNFYEWLAEWRRYVMVPWTAPNPLLESRPHPGAALLDYAFGVAGIDLVPGATAPNTAPEHLWSTMLRWHEHIDARFGKLKVWTRIRQPDCLA